MSDISWNYSREEQEFELPPEGDVRIRIKSADKAVSSNGNDMINVVFEVSNSTALIYHHIVFLPDRPELTNRNLTKFFDSFSGLQEGKFNLSSWVGQVGAANIKHDEYEGKKKAVINYFISKNKQDNLPPWVEKTARTNNSSSASGGGFVDITSDDELPF